VEPATGGAKYTHIELSGPNSQPNKASTTTNNTA
jgi:hypothetical protein